MDAIIDNFFSQDSPRNGRHRSPGRFSRLHFEIAQIILGPSFRTIFRGGLF